MAELAPRLSQYQIPVQERLAGKIQGYPRKLFMAAEATLADQLDEKPKIPDILADLIRKDSSKYERTVATLNLMSLFVPSEVKKYILSQIYSYSQRKMPFNPEEYTLKRKIGRGGVNDVYLLESQREGLDSFALKFSRNPEDIVQVSSEQRDEFQTIASVYKHIEGLVPQEYYVALHGLGGKPVSAMLQLFEGGNIRDIFRDFAPGELST